MVFVAGTITEAILGDAAAAQTQTLMATWELGRQTPSPYEQFSPCVIAAILLLGIGVTKWVEVLFPLWGSPLQLRDPCR
jgi:uncharacterized membrane protein YeaQ/YmgE (transglycosylase-associated protein family)